MKRLRSEGSVMPTLPSRDAQDRTIAADEVGPDEIERRLGRHCSTIFREPPCNHFHDSNIPKLSGYSTRMDEGHGSVSWCPIPTDRPGRVLPKIRMDKQPWLCLVSGRNGGQFKFTLHNPEEEIR